MIKDATVFKRVSYALLCNECEEPIVDNIELAELLDLGTPESRDIHSRKEESQGGLWLRTQNSIVKHHRTHSIPEPRCSCGYTLDWHDRNNLKRCQDK
jgi:hypothetical protein